MTHENEFDLGDDLEITKVSRRTSGGGTWVSGTLHGHRFDALVFPEHAEVAEYELGDSRISKLWVQRIADKTTTFNWDRGMDQPAADPITQAIVDFLAAGLADHTYAEYTRFTAACLARHQCTLIQDDDLELPIETLCCLNDAWRQDPDILHGIFGRRPKADGSYDPRNVASGEAPVVLTRALLTSRRCAADFFDVAPEFELIQREGKPAGNGEDILFS